MNLQRKRLSKKIDFLTTEEYGFAVPFDAAESHEHAKTLHTRQSDSRYRDHAFTLPSLTSWRINGRPIKDVSLNLRFIPRSAVELG